MQETFIGIIVVLTSTFFTLFLLAIVYINKYFREKKASQEQLYSAIFEAQEKERQVIASNIHDDLGGILTAAKISVSALLSDVEMAAQFRPMLSQVQQHLATASQMARNASNSLSPTSITRYGLKGALSDLVDRIEKLGYTVDFRYQLDIKLPEGIQMNLYRVINEVFNNALKYAQATELYLIVQLYEQSTIQVKIGDNGIGFDWNQISVQTKSQGLQNLQNRCKFINAQMVVESKANIGTHYQISFQLNN